ncbi:MAG: hypothetical protein M3N13_09670 [Candidatus Eremiobacteraeota bacterium]|nr:hypothetical protein [Candidatus Eremiobacteraeota bacterium]
MVPSHSAPVTASGTGAAKTTSMTMKNPNDPSWCYDSWACGAGSAPGSGSSGVGGNNNGDQVALQRPAPAMPCRGSDSVGITLDDQLPFGSTGTNNDVNNIFYLYEGATISANGIPGGQLLVGWIAVTANNYFVVSNGKDANLVHNLAQQVPVLGQLWNAVNNSTTAVISPPLNAAQINQVFQDYPVNSKTGSGSAPCFTNPLPQSQWT